LLGGRKDNLLAVWALDKVPPTRYLRGASIPS